MTKDCGRSEGSQKLLGLEFLGLDSWRSLGSERGTGQQVPRRVAPRNDESWGFALSSV